MKAPSRLFSVLIAAIVALAFGCQNTEQSSVQPEKLASSSPAVASANAPASGAPFAPFASGKGPQDLDAPTDPSSTAAAEGGDEPEFNPDGPAPTPAPAQPAVEKREPGVVKLVKAGAKPHKLLRLTPKVGDVSAVEMVMTTEISMEIDGKKPPTGMVPPIVFVMDTKVQEISADGDIHYGLNVSEAGVRAVPGVQPQVITALNKALGTLVGLSGKMVMTNRGITKEMKLSMPGKQSAQTAQVLQGMEQAMQQLSAPLPEEPVGKGAQWTHSSTVKQNGISLSQVATYDLVKVSGDKVTFKIALSQSAPKQKVASPVGVTVDLISLKSKGKGTSKLRLDRLTPIKSSMKVATKAVMGLPKNQKMKMDSTLTVEMGKPSKKKTKKAEPKPSKTESKAPPAPPPAPKTAP